MIKAAAREQCPVVHPEQPGFDGVTIAQLSGPPLARRRRLAERRRRLHRNARLEQAVHLDRRDRPVAVRHRDVREDGDASREGPAPAATRTSVTPACSARSSPDASSRRRGRQVSGRRPDARRPGLDHRHGDLRRRSRTIRSPTASPSETSGSDGSYGWPPRSAMSCIAGSLTNTFAG